MFKFCLSCPSRSRCEETSIQICKLKDNEYLVESNGKFIIVSYLNF